MKTYLKLIAFTATLALSIPAAAQSEPDEDEALRIAAVEALISAPPGRALPLARKVVEGNYSDDLKERALFVLSQINEPEARELILAVARDGSGDLREEAIRMIGISGNGDALAQLGSLYSQGDDEVRGAVLDAFIIAHAEESVYQLALEAPNEEAFAELVETLAVMGAHDKLRLLRERGNQMGSEANEALIEAYAISGDLESLQALARNASDPEQQLKAIEGIGIVGSSEGDATLVEIYRASDNDEVREAVIEGLMISGNDQAMLALYRESTDAAEKRRILEYLVAMGSEEIWQVIDQALEGSE